MCDKLKLLTNHLFGSNEAGLNTSVTLSSLTSFFRNMNSKCSNGGKSCVCENLSSMLNHVPDDAKAFVNIVRPILLGKIAFAPNHKPDINRIIEKANSTFMRIETFNNLIKDLASFLQKLSPDLDRLPNLIDFDLNGWRDQLDFILQVNPNQHFSGERMAFLSH